MLTKAPIRPRVLGALGALAALGVLGVLGVLGALGALGALATLGALGVVVVLGVVVMLGCRWQAFGVDSCFFLGFLSKGRRVQAEEWREGYILVGQPS